MRARVTLAVGLPYQIDRVTLAVGLSFCLHSHVNASGRVTLSSGSSYSPSVNVKQTKMVTTLK